MSLVSISAVLFVGVCYRKHNNW